MNVNQFYARLSERIPPSLSCAWDNDGLMVCPDGGRPVTRVLCTLDVTDEAVSYAIANRFDVIVSHHPLIFHPLTAITPDDHVARKCMRLLAAGISVMSFHTRADAVSDGVNDRLCDLLGLSDAAPLGDGEDGRIGRIARLDAPMTLSGFAAHVKETLDLPALLLSDAERPVQQVAVCGGDGKDMIPLALAAGADTLLSGRIGYHPMTDAPEIGLNMLEAGHYYTETHITGFFAELTKEIIPGASVEKFASDVIMCY